MGWLGRRRRAAFAASLACLAVAVSPGAARSGQVTLSGDGPADGTLRGEIAQAVAGETITFAPGVNPVVTLGEITINTEITLVGNGSGQTTITGSTDRVFRIQAGSTQTVTIQDLKITG